MPTGSGSRPTDLIQRDASAPALQARIPLADVLAAMSRSLDLAMGLPMGHALRSCAIGMRIGRMAGLDDATLSHLYYALLLKDSGCSVISARLAALFGAEDHLLQPALGTMNREGRMSSAAATRRMMHSSRDVACGTIRRSPTSRSRC